MSYSVPSRDFHSNGGDTQRTAKQTKQDDCKILCVMKVQMTGLDRG